MYGVQHITTGQGVRINNPHSSLFMSTNVYIDGFNFYYGCVRHTEFKWLDFRALIRELYPELAFNTIYYFTAMIKGDDEGHSRQKAYINVLKKSNITVIEGVFSKRIQKRDLATSKNKQQQVKIWNIEEKGSDVNIACQMIIDAYEDNCTDMLLVSNDSDLLMPIKQVKCLGKQVYIAFPVAKSCAKNSKKKERHISASLKRAADSYKRITFQILKKSQFPDIVAGIKKPAAWNKKG